MKVLKKGREQNGWAIETLCTGIGNGNGGCGALLLVEQGDLYKTHKYDYGGGHDIFITFRCPDCEVQTDLDDVPGNVTNNIPEKEPRKGLDYE